MTYEEAIEYISNHYMAYVKYIQEDAEKIQRHNDAMDIAIECIKKQMPKKVEWTLDYTWGVEKEVPVCPTCGYYLTPIQFIDADICEQTGHCEFLKISYCEHCSQAIDWSDEDDDA